jgi:hypothetical protein
VIGRRSAKECYQHDKDTTSLCCFKRGKVKHVHSVSSGRASLYTHTCRAIEECEEIVMIFWWRRAMEDREMLLVFFWRKKYYIGIAHKPIQFSHKMKIMIFDQGHSEDMASFRSPIYHGSNPLSLYILHHDACSHSLSLEWKSNDSQTINFHCLEFRDGFEGPRKTQITSREGRHCGGLVFDSSYELRYQPCCLGYIHYKAT